MSNTNRVAGGQEMMRREGMWSGEQGKDGSLGELDRNFDRALDQTLDQVLDHLGPRAVFGEPVRQGNMTVVPVAEARIRFGFGSGKGRQRQKMGTSGGGGGGGRIVPWGYIAITKKGVTFEAFKRPRRRSRGGRRVARLALMAAAVWGVATWMSTSKS